jgi:flagellar motility protein MotE (MotC chaperone)
MKINEFKKLEKKINNYSFNQNYKSINIIMTILSYFGHLVSIFLAYFFMSKVLSSAIVDNYIFVFITSIIILGGLELLKRDIFDKFSIQSIKDKTISKAAIPLFLTSLLLISGSFYSSINGAKEFSSKSEQIEKVKEDKISQYRDSLNLSYSGLILEVDQEIKGYKSLLLTKDAEQTRINESLSERGFLTKSEKDRNAQLAVEKKELNEKISNSDSKIERLKSEKDKQIEEYESKLTEKTDSQKKNNTKNSFLFVMISTLIELVILGGVYFSEYYKFRSYREFRDKIEKDPNYQKWLLFEQMLNVVITDESKMNQKLPSNKTIIEMCKVSDTIVLQKDVTEFLKVLVSLGIVKASGSVKYITKTRDIAHETLRKHFNIE